MIFFLFIFNLFVLIGIVAVGLSLVSWAYVQVFGFSPTAWELTLPYCIYLVLGVAADMAFFGLLLSLFVKKKGVHHEKAPGSFRLIGAIIFFLIGFVAVLYGLIFPGLERTLGGSGWLGGLQKGMWPDAIGLADFHVCAREIRYSLTNKKMGKGPIRFEIVNRSPVLLKEATFTVLAGRDPLKVMAGAIPSSVMGDDDSETNLCESSPVGTSVLSSRSLVFSFRVSA